MDFLMGYIVNKSKGIGLGLILLILVIIVKVFSLEMSKYVSQPKTFDKPFFCTYIKISFLTVYLFSLILCSPWKARHHHRPKNYAYLDTSEDDDSIDESQLARLTSPIYVPLKGNLEAVSETENNDSSLRLVRFNKLAEVRQLNEAEARDALLSRLSYQAFLRANDSHKRSLNHFLITSVARVSFLYLFVFFAANVTYQMALIEIQFEALSIYFSMMSFFTLVLSGIYSSNYADKFTVTKLFAVILNIFNTVLISLTSSRFENKISVGSILSLLSALFYSVYLVFFKRTFDAEQKLDISLFFGFMGLFNMILLWPVLFFLHFLKLETFEWPTREQLIYLFLNSFMEIIIPEALWLWGCLLTSPLIAAMAKSMTMPLTMLINIMVMNISYSYLLYLALISLMIAFFMTIICSFFEHWDPISHIFSVVYPKSCKKTGFSRLCSSRPKEVGTSEQLEALISVNNTLD